MSTVCIRPSLEANSFYPKKERAAEAVRFAKYSVIQKVNVFDHLQDLPEIQTSSRIKPITVRFVRFAIFCKELVG